MSKNSERVKKWRQTTKKRLITAFGGSCAICGYDKCDDVLEFHHINPEEKEFNWGGFRGNIKGWNTIVKEMQKCVMLCSNCHKEVHSSLSDTIVPNNAPRFNMEFVDYKDKERRELELIDNCPVCGNEKASMNTTCSRSCAAKLAGKTVDWSKYDVLALVEEHGSYAAVGDLLHVSGAAVSRRCKKIRTGKY